MSLKPRLEAGSLLLHLLGSPPHNAKWRQKIAVTRCEEDGLQWEIHSPKHAKPRAVLIAVPGAVMEGERDRRLTHLADRFAGLGFQVICPALPGLKRFVEDPADIDVLEKIILASTRQSQQSLSIIGFSFGASIALLAAARASIRKQIGLIVAMNPYHCYHQLMQDMASAVRNDRMNESTAFVLLARALRNPEAFHLSIAQRSTASELAAGYCERRDNRPAVLFAETVLKKAIVPEVEFQCDRGIADAYSPRGHLDDITARVMLIHGQDDRLVPARHSEKIFDELNRRIDGANNTRLVIASMLNHFTVRSLFHPLEGLQIVDVFAEILTQRAK